MPGKGVLGRLDRKRIYRNIINSDLVRWWEQSGLVGSPELVTRVLIVVLRKSFVVSIFPLPHRKMRRLNLYCGVEWYLGIELTLWTCI